MPMILTLRRSNSGLIFAMYPSSVVHTGVKSLGWENSTAQALPIQSWNVIFPCVVSAGSASEIEQLAALKSTSQERLKHEVADFFEEATRFQPLVLFFDDLHWADESTTDLLLYVSEQLNSWRMLIIGTYRPAVSRVAFDRDAPGAIPSAQRVQADPQRGGGLACAIDLLGHARMLPMQSHGN